MESKLQKNELESWRAFLRAYATVVKVLEGEMLREQGLPLAWYDVLVHLSEAAEGRLRLQGLADSVLLSRSGVTRLVDRMVEAGLVRRESCPDDRRGSYAVITDQGCEALRQAAPGHLAGIARHFVRHLCPEEIGTLGAAFAKILRAEAHDGAAPAVTKD